MIFQLRKYKNMEIKKLNLGCGKDYKEGWVNLDFNTFIKADVYHDFNKGLPFEDNSFDIVLAKKSLEDVSDINKLIEEIWRVLKPDGLFKFHVTFAGSIFDYHYLHHKQRLIPRTFDVFIGATSLNKRWGYTTKARFKKKKVTVRPIFFHIRLPEIFQYISIFCNILGGFEGEFIAVK